MLKRLVDQIVSARERRRQKRRIEGMFGTYIDPKLVADILSKEEAAGYSKAKHAVDRCQRDPDTRPLSSGGDSA